MSATVLAGVGLLGGLGACARYLLDETISEREATVFPVGILVVNLLGALLIGVVSGAGLHGDAVRLLAAGLLGGFTTFSTWMLDSHRLAENGHRHALWLNVAVSVACGLLAVWIGRAIGQTL